MIDLGRIYPPSLSPDRLGERRTRRGDNDPPQSSFFPIAFLFLILSCQPSTLLVYLSFEVLCLHSPSLFPIHFGLLLVESFAQPHKQNSSIATSSFILISLQPKRKTFAEIPPSTKSQPGWLRQLSDLPQTPG